MPHPKLAQFKALGQYLDLLLDAICVVNSNGEFIYVSGGGERVFGYKPEEMIGHSMFKFMHPEDHDKTRAVVAEIMQGIAKINVENRYIRKNGDIAHILWSARYSKEDDFRIAVARDVPSNAKQRVNDYSFCKDSNSRRFMIRLRNYRIEPTFTSVRCRFCRDVARLHFFISTLIGLKRLTTLSVTPLAIEF